jgi:HEAT repeat protein
MPVTMEDVRRALDADEVDYVAAATVFGRDALPHLERFAQGPDVMLASKAVYLASVIGGEAASSILADAAGSPQPPIRVAAASGLRNLAEGGVESVADRLLGDADVGVRKVALVSAAQLGAGMAERVREVARHDPEPVLRDLAGRLAGDA